MDAKQQSFIAAVFSAAAVTPALAQQQVFSSVAAQEGSAASILSVDVTAHGRVALHVGISRYTGPLDGLTRLRRGIPLTHLPGIGDILAQTSQDWALADGRVTGRPFEVFVLGADDGTVHTPFLWGRAQAPDLPGLTLAWTPAFNATFTASDDGALFSLARLENVASPGDFVIVRASPTLNRTLFRFGTDPLGRPSTLFNASSDAVRLASNARGACVFTGLMMAPGVSGPGLLYADDASARVVVDRLSVLPSPLPAAARLLNLFVPPTLNDAGEVVFMGGIQGAPGVMDGLFRWTPDGGLTLLRSSPFAAPEFGADVTARLNQSGVLALSGGSDILLSVRLSGPGIGAANDTALALLRAGELIPIAREGSVIPDRAPRTFGEHSTFSSYAYLNARGQVLFRSAFADAPGGGSGVGVFGWSRGAGLRTYFLTGDRLDFDGSGTVVTQIPAPNYLQFGNFWLHTSGGQDGRLSMLTEDGAAVVPAAFSNNARWGLYRIDLPAPCPPDLNADGFADHFDYALFIEAFESGGPLADFNHDGFSDFFDYLDFVGAFERGC